MTTDLKTESIGDILVARAKTHGSYIDHARVTQDTLDYWRKQKNWDKLSPTQRETLHMISHKVGRILCGSPDEPDHWLDISGYCTLIVNELKARVDLSPSGPPDYFALLSKSLGLEREELRKRVMEVAPPKQEPQKIKYGSRVVCIMDKRHGVAASLSNGGDRYVQFDTYNSSELIDPGTLVLESVWEEHCVYNPKRKELIPPPGTPEDGGQHAPRDEVGMEVGLISGHDFRTDQPLRDGVEMAHASLRPRG